MKNSNCVARHRNWSESDVTRDTTSRSKIDGDWPALILIFSNNRRVPLQPIFFAFEDRDQIVRLILETYSRLACTLMIDERPVTANELWEKTMAFMTDSVSKNLKVEDGVAEALQSDHKPSSLQIAPIWMSWLRLKSNCSFARSL